MVCASVLLVGTASFAQQPADSGAAPVASPSSDGRALPAIVVETRSQRKATVAPRRKPSQVSRTARTRQAPNPNNAVVQARPVSAGTLQASLPAAFPGEQVARGAGVGLLGNRDVMSTPFSLTSFTEKTIRDQQARTLMDVLGNDPSVRTNVPAYSGIQGFFIRGFPVFAQDIAFNGLYGVADSFNPALEPIERVEVQHGPSTMLSGMPPFGTIGGTINLIPKRAADVPLTRFTTGFISSGQSYNAVDVGRRYGQNGEWGVRFNGAYQAGNTPIDNQKQEYGVTALALDYRGERLRLGLDLGYQKGDFDSPLRNRSVLPGFPIPSAPDLRINQQQPWEYRNSDNKSAAVRAEYDLTDQLTVYAAYGHSEFHQVYFGGLPSIINARGDFRSTIQLTPFQTYSDTGEVGLRGQFETGAIKHRIGVAASGLWQDTGLTNIPVGSTITSNLYNPVYVAARSDAGLPRTSPVTAQRFNRSVAIADTMSILNDRVELTIGGRWQGIDARTLSPTTGQVTSDARNDAFSPGVGLVIKPIERLSLYANYIEGLTSTAPPINAVNLNQSFPATVAKQIEAGAKYDFGPVGVTLAGFEIKQPSGFLDPTTRVFALNGEQRNRGVELNVFGQPLEGLRVVGGVSWIEGVLTQASNPAHTGNTAVGVPAMQLNLYGEYDLPAFARGVTLTGRVIHTASQFYDQANTQSIPAWTTLDLGLRYATKIDRTPVTIRANVQNVTGLNYWATTGRGILSPGAPRTYLVSASFDF
ncbi:TonB-dependent siderophore receptor [Rhodopseudomonas sp. AAP120]|uniref:TonB-dependent receptor n=1 Tax=Rhodopseudomonas sp. AAP120 TaxID=1523430 RepID=UPI001FD89317|nr:TonB-dependent siderophore receptor [Rhodopseudomonas sp. AAP120]